MSDMQQVEEQEAAPQQGEPRLSTAEDKSRVQRKKLADKGATVFITAGGLVTIASIVAILIVIVAEVLPLLLPAVATPQETIDLLPLIEAADQPAAAAGLPGLSTASDRPLAVGIEEYQEIAYVVTSAGTVDFFSLHDNSLIHRYTINALQERSPTVAYTNGIDHIVAVGTTDGLVIPLVINFVVTFPEGKRTSIPTVDEQEPLRLDPAGQAITGLVYRKDGGKTSTAALTGPRRLFFLAQRARRTLIGPAPVQEHHLELSAELTADVTAVAFDRFQLNLLVGTATGEVLHWHIDNPEHPQFMETFAAATAPGAGISALGWVLGDRSLIVGDTAGGVNIWFQIRDQKDPTKLPYRRVHQFLPHSAPVTAFATSPRDKGFLSADAAGTVMLQHSTSEQTLLQLPTDAHPIPLLAFAPKADGLVATNTEGEFFRWKLRNPHPEITLKTLFGKVWYEGYEQPEYTWQSTGGTDDFEAKFSLTPLAYGTLKGTFYALLLAVPISICAAIYTSQFLHPTLRNLIKPSMEIMAALPSVVLGFFAGLWLAPLVEQIVPAVFLMFFALPTMTLLAAFLWRLIPLSIRLVLKSGSELAVLCPVLVLTVYACVSFNGTIEAFFFNGNFPQWLFDTTGMRYDPRNSMVVGFAMGFAVIPIIYTICEDAFSNVPQHLISGSLALGATRWQTALRVVMPTASPGVFSAIMIGFGRAVGETMIVLMATGNTPVMDFSPFNGFRALSANIAVEIPEAPHGGTLYRVLFLAALLLFILTFIVNTAAEIVRQRLRERYSRV